MTSADGQDPDSGSRATEPGSGTSTTGPSHVGRAGSSLLMALGGQLTRPVRIPPPTRGSCTAGQRSKPVAEVRAERGTSPDGTRMWPRATSNSPVTSTVTDVGLGLVERVAVGWIPALAEPGLSGSGVSITNPDTQMVARSDRAPRRRQEQRPTEFPCPTVPDIDRPRSSARRPPLGREGQLGRGDPSAVNRRSMIGSVPPLADGTGRSGPRSLPGDVDGTGPRRPQMRQPTVQLTLTAGVPRTCQPPARNRGSAATR